MNKEIEIPFGAKDSELKGWEYTIPEDMEAEIKDGKIIVREKESEDEKIRKQLIGFFSGRYALCNINTKDAIAYLERQKEQQPAEWSETDKLHLNNAILVAKKEWGVNSYTARWLESLRDNYKKCNCRWKPSEEQMWALDVALENFYHQSDRSALESLKTDLQKL